MPFAIFDLREFWGASSFMNLPTVKVNRSFINRREDLGLSP